MGTLQAEALVRAGVGQLTLVDRDFVEASNLQRQFLYEEQHAIDSVPKAIAARQRLQALNSTVCIHAEVADLEPRNIHDLCRGADLLLDGTDNFETRYLINDYAVETNTPWIYGAAVGTYGLSMTIVPGETACLRCIYPDPPAGVQPTCETAGVLSAATMLVASVQTAEALKLLTGNKAALRRTIYTADLWTNSMREVPMPSEDPDCPACGRKELEWLQGKHRAPVSLCGRNAVQIHSERPVNLQALALLLQPLGTVRHNEYALRFWSGPYELTVFPDGRSIVKGTTDPGIARAVCTRYLG